MLKRFYNLVIFILITNLCTGLYSASSKRLLIGIPAAYTAGWYVTPTVGKLRGKPQFENRRGALPTTAAIAMYVVAYHGAKMSLLNQLMHIGLSCSALKIGQLAGRDYYTRPANSITNLYDLD